MIEPDCLNHTREQFALWHFTAQLQSANAELHNAMTDAERITAEKKQVSASEMILRLRTLDQFAESTTRQEHHVAIQSLQTDLLNLALRAKPITPSLQCILDYLGPNPKKLKTHLNHIAHLSEPISNTLLKKMQSTIAANLFKLIKSGLLSVTEFTDSSSYDPTEPRISELAWATIFVDHSLTDELVSGTVRRYRLFPKYFEQSTPRQLQNYSLACPAAVGKTEFSTDLRTQFTQSDEEIYQRPTIAYLCDGFRHAQKIDSSNSLCHTDTKMWAATDEEIFLLHLYNTDTYSYMQASSSHETNHASTFNALIRALILEELRTYRNQLKPIHSSQEMRAWLPAIHNEYQCNQNDRPLKTLCELFHFVSRESAAHQSNPEYRAFFNMFQEKLKIYIRKNLQLIKEHAQTEESKKLLNEFYLLVKNDIKIGLDHASSLDLSDGAFQKFLEKFLQMLTDNTYLFTEHTASTHAIKGSIFKPVVTNHLRLEKAEWIAQTIDHIFITPLRLHLTVPITQLQSAFTLSETELNQLSALVKKLSMFANGTSKVLNRHYTEQSLHLEHDLLEQKLQKECQRVLRLSLSSVATFAETQATTNEALEAALMSCHDLAFSAMLPPAQNTHSYQIN